MSCHSTDPKSSSASISTNYFVIRESFYIAHIFSLFTVTFGGESRVAVKF